MKTYEVVIQIEGQPQPLMVQAHDRDEAQEKAIDYCETWNLCHGNIVSIHAI